MAHENFKGDNLADYFQTYIKALHESLSKVTVQSLNAALNKIKSTLKTSNHIYVAGNGGSAAISDHLCCDFTKGTYIPSQPCLKTHSLSSNTAVITALGNDLGYEDIFSHQLKMLGQKDDLVILVSSSGNSANIVKAAKTAREMGMQTIALTGFSGGDVSSLVEVHLHVPINNYGVVEDSHQAIMHVLSQFINQERGKAAAQ
jgi:D-sedoheptulose 7-phosphate isomerase